MLKIAVCYENFAGVGHAGIVSKLAHEVAAFGGETVCITGSGLPTTSGKMFNFPPEASFVALPTLEKDAKTGRAEFTSRGLTYEADTAFQEERADTIIKTLRHERPQILITDSWPWGKGKLDAEMLPVLDEAKALGIQIMPMIRDVGFYPNHRKDMTPQQIDDHIAAIVNDQTRGIIITGDQNMFTLEDWYPQAAAITTERFYPGYFSETPKQRQDFLNGQDRPVVFSLGGGFVPNPDLLITEAVLTNHEKSQYKHHPLYFFISHDCPEASFEKIKGWAAHNNRITLIQGASSDEYQQHLANSAASISQCGLNTCVETLRTAMTTNIPVIYVPRYKGEHSLDQEQTFRAAKLDRLGMATMMNPDHYHDSNLYLDRLAFAAQRPVIANMNYNMNGARNAAEILYNIAGEAIRAGVTRYTTRMQGTSPVLRMTAR